VDLEAILARGGKLTDEEEAFLERELVKATRELHTALLAIQREIAATDPRLAAQLGRSASSMLTSVEKAASLPWPNGNPGALAD
jgi:hypothetical protein